MLAGAMLEKLLIISGVTALTAFLIMILSTSKFLGNCGTYTLSLLRNP